MERRRCEEMERRREMIQLRIRSDLQALTAKSYADLVTLTFDLKTGLRSTCDNFGLS